MCVTDPISVFRVVTLSRGAGAPGIFLELLKCAGTQVIIRLMAQAKVAGYHANSYPQERLSSEL